MPNPSFGAIMASAADQSRIAREKDEANQLAMMQAGFVPKEQPPQPEPSGLQSMLSSVRDQYAYQPEYAPTDYVPGPAHASSMQAKQHEQELKLLGKEQEFGGRHDEIQKRKWVAEIAHQEGINGWLNREMQSKIAARDAQTGLTKGQTTLTGLQSSAQIIENSFDRRMNELKIDNVRSEGAILTSKLQRDRELHPYNVALMRAGIAAKELQVFKGGSALVTDANGTQHWLEYSPETGQVTSKVWSTPDTPMSEQLASIRVGFQILGTMDSNSDEYKALSKRLSTAYTIATLEGDIESGAAEGKGIIRGKGSDQGPAEEEEEASGLTEEQIRAIDKKRERGKSTPEQRQNKFLKANPPKNVDKEDWKWWVKNRGKSLSARQGAARFKEIDEQFTSYAEALLEKWKDE